MNYLNILAKAAADGDGAEILGRIWDTLANWALNTGIKIVISVIILLVSFKIINKVARKLEKHSEKKNFDKTLTRTLTYTVKIACKLIICICIVGYLGINTSGLSALVASLGVCVGLAVNGALSNLAGGVLIIITRPFKIDDFIELQGISGVVEDIHIINTKIRTVDNKVVYIPNGAVIAGNITNYSEKDTRRVDITFSIAYENDFQKANAIIMGICEKHELVLKDPDPFVRVVEQAESSIKISARAWVKTEDYWTVYFDLTEAVKKAFDENGISIPYNQLDVHVKKD